MEIQAHIKEVLEALLLLSNAPSPDRQPDADIHPKTAPHRPPVAEQMTSAENAPSILFPMWGSRSKRSRDKIKSKSEQEDRPSLFAASCIQRSPNTPLEFVTDSDPSTSGNDGVMSFSESTPWKNFRSGELSAPRRDASIKFKFSTVGETPSVEAGIASSQPIVRHSRKRTFSELVTEEGSLVEEKNKLVKLLESLRMRKEALVTENRRLSIFLTCSLRSPAEVKPIEPKLLLPDLNEPASELD